jgi:hypothetical protein
MDKTTLISILTICCTIIGWKIVDMFNQRRDALLKRKNIRIDYLIKAWRLLESASNRENNELIKNLETAIADIQLFGTYEQIKLAQEISREMSEKNIANTLELLKALRKDLRKELKLDKVPDELRFLRIKE